MRLFTLLLFALVPAVAVIPTAAADDKLPEPTKRGTQHHICLSVPDIEKAVKTLEARPYFKTYGKPLEIRTGVNRKRQCNLYDPDGTRIELMEPFTIDRKPTPSATAAAPPMP